MTTFANTAEHLEESRFMFPFAPIARPTHPRSWQFLKLDHSFQECQTYGFFDNHSHKIYSMREN